jgi:hypothetical protein
MLFRWHKVKLNEVSDVISISKCREIIYFERPV